MLSTRLIILTFCSGLINSFYTNGQNLVPNAGFESLAGCPTSSSQLYLASPWDSLNASPDVFSGCATSSPVCSSVSIPSNFAGSSPAHSGNSYAGITAYSSIPEYREYIQAPLLAPLSAGKIYKVEAWVRLASGSTHAVSSLGITLSAGPLTQFGTSPLGFVPLVISNQVVSDPSQWTLLRGFIVAFGGENNVVIGNFRNDAASGIVSTMPLPGSCTFSGAYYYIDDVRVEQVTESLSISGDTIICPGNFTTLNGNSNTVLWWSVASNPTVPVSYATSFTVNPAVTTTYILNGILSKIYVTVNVISPPTVNLGPDTTVCERTVVLLNAFNPGCSYLWSTGSSAASIEVLQTGTYTVSVSNAGCSAVDTININVLTNPPINLGTDSVFCSLTQDFITLIAGNSGISYQWNPTLETTSSILVKTPGLYSVTVQYANGCSKTESISIKEICQPRVYIPAAFSPNGDGINDFLELKASSITSFSFRIFNRFGMIVFDSTEMERKWDGTFRGKPAPSGIYPYVIFYTSLSESGKTEDGSLKGTILLIR